MEEEEIKLNISKLNISKLRQGAPCASPRPALSHIYANLQVHHCVSYFVGRVCHAPALAVPHSSLLAMVLLQGFGGGAAHVGVSCCSAIKLSQVSQNFLFGCFKPVKPIHTGKV